MNKISLFIIILCCFNLQAMEQEQSDFSPLIKNYNSYKGVPITPETILKLAPPMEKDLEEVVTPWVQENTEFLKKLVSTPHPLNTQTHKEKTATNTKLIAECTNLKNLSDFNYILKPTDNDDFVARINRWGSRIAYLIHATNQGNPLDDKFDREKIDYSKIEYVKTYQHISNVAHYLKLSELLEKNGNSLKTPPTHLVHIPGQPTDCCDENYICVQKYIKGFIELRDLKTQDNPRYIETIKNFSEEFLQEAHDAIKNAALWDFAYGPVLGVTKEGKYVLDLEEPFTHKPTFFYYQGKEGYIQYLKDAYYGLERMSELLKGVDQQQYEKWKRICEKNDKDLMDECKKYTIEPYNFVNGETKIK